MKNTIKFFSFGLILAIAGGISSLIIYKIVEEPKKVEKEESEEDKAPPRLKVPIRDH